jgi:beta-phosphoglucomutase
MHILEKFIGHNHISTCYPDTKGVLWDMDGTIMETETLHAHAVMRLLEEHQVQLNQELLELKEFCTGMTDAQVLIELQKRDYLSELTNDHFINRKNDHFFEMLEELSHEKIFHQSIRDLMQELQSAGIRQAVVTSSERDVTHRLLGQLDLTDFFEFIITREDVEHNKPHPMPYLMAIEKMQLPKEHITIFEDSHTGLKAAKESGANVFHVKWYEGFGD